MILNILYLRKFLWTFTGKIFALNILKIEGFKEYSKHTKHSVVLCGPGRLGKCTHVYMKFRTLQNKLRQRKQHKTSVRTISQPSLIIWNFQRKLFTSFMFLC